MSTASILIHSLGWALLHSIWQGALIFALLKLVLAAFPGVAARVKYHLSYIALCSMFFWFAASFYQEWLRLQAITIRITEGGTDAAGYKVFFIKAFPPQSSYLSDSLLLQVERNFPFLITLYMIGVLVLSFRFILNLLQVHLLRTKGVNQAPLHVLGILEQLQVSLQIERKIKLLISEKINVPVVFGTIKPVILLPIATINQLSTEQLEAILIHELAHIKRYDFLLNIFQSVVETILFFNPFTWLISSFIRREREHCCDDLVVQHTQQPLPYAQALAALEAYRSSAGSFAMAANGQSNHLLNRIKRIVEMRKDPLNYSQLIVAFILIATLSISIVWLTPAFAQTKKDKEKKKEQSAAPRAKPGTAVQGKVVVIDDKGERTEYTSAEELPEHVKKTIENSVTAAEAGAKTAEEAVRLAGTAMKDMDFSGISEELNTAFAEIDWQGISADMNKAMKEIDWEKMNRDMEQAMKEAGRQLNDPQVREEIRSRIREAQAEARKGAAEAHKAVAEAHKSMAEARKEVAVASRQRAQADQELAHARKTIAEAKAGRQGAPVAAARSGYTYAYSYSTGYDGMLKQMEKDGLITRKDGFTIKKSGNTLSINGKQQERDIYNKYRRYLKDENIVIRGDDEDLTIRIRN